MTLAARTQSSPAERIARHMRLAEDVAATRTMCPPSVAPPAGCVLLDAYDRWLTVTAPSGPGIHAEVIGIRKANQAGPATRDGTAVLTMEPCPDCAVALVKAGIRRVFYAVANPHGGGTAILTESGVEVITGVCEADVLAGALRPWLYYQRTGQPFITWVYAGSPWGRLGLLDNAPEEVTVELQRRQMTADIAFADADGTDAADIAGRHPKAGHVLIQDFPGGLLPAVNRVVQYVAAGMHGPTRVPMAEWVDAVSLVSTELVGTSVTRTVWEVDQDAIRGGVALSARA